MRDGGRRRDQQHVAAGEQRRERRVPAQAAGDGQRGLRPRTVPVSERSVGSRSQTMPRRVPGRRRATCVKRARIDRRVQAEHFEPCAARPRPALQAPQGVIGSPRGARTRAGSAPARRACRRSGAAARMASADCRSRLTRRRPSAAFDEADAGTGVVEAGVHDIVRELREVCAPSVRRAWPPGPPDDELATCRRPASCRPARRRVTRYRGR